MNYSLNNMDDVTLKQEPIRIRIVQFKAMQSGRYRNQYTRPYEMGNVTHGVIETIGTRLEQGAAITPDQLAGLTDKLIAPSVKVESEVFIPSGMGDFRFFFNMIVEIRQGMRINYEMISGYTDHFGYINNTVDPNMIFYIDGIVNANSSKRRVGGQMVEVMQPSMISQLLPDRRFAEYNQGNAAMQFRMRPQEVVRGIHHAGLPGLDGVQPLDFSSINNMTAKSQRVYNSPSHYAANILDGYRQGINAASADPDGYGFINTTNADIIQSVVKALKTPSSVEDTFLSALSEVTGLPAPNSFTLRDLERIDPNVDNVIHFHTLDATGLQRVTDKTHGANWNSEDRETQIAAVLAQSVPNIMMTLGISAIAFTSDNLQPAFGHNVRLQNLDCVSQLVNTVALRQQFIDEMSRTVLQDISFNNQIQYVLTMSLDLNSEARIFISLEGQEVIEYFMPCWCSALMAPVVTQNVRRLESLSRGFNQLFDAIGLSPLQAGVEYMAETDPMVLNDITHGAGGPQYNNNLLPPSFDAPSVPTAGFGGLLPDAGSLNI